MIRAAELQVACDDPGIPEENHFQRWAAAALSGGRAPVADGAEDEDGPPGRVSLCVVGERESRTLNKRFRDRDKATNVLSFPADLHPVVESDLLGDVVVCAPVVVREAREQGKNELDHWAHMVVHGVLHLLGHDHQTEAETRAMETLETAILHGLGVADPYAQQSETAASGALDEV